jgi:hypothetical protein
MRELQIPQITEYIYNTQETGKKTLIRRGQKEVWRNLLNDGWILFCNNIHNTSQ